MQNYGDSELALPMDFDLKPKNSAPPCRSRRVNVQPLSGSIFNPGDVAKLELPVGRKGEYLDGSQTYLLFTIDNTDTAALGTWWADHSCASFIQKLEIYSSSQLIETINEYGLLYSIILDSQTGALDRMGFQTITMGTDTDGVSNSVNFQRGGVQVDKAKSRTFALPLFSGVIGTGLDKYLPIGDLQDLRVEITWANSATAVVSATGTSSSVNVWRVSTCELVLQVLNLDDSVDNMIHAASPGGIMLSSHTFRNYNTVLNSAGTTDSTIVPLKFTSLKSVMAAYRTSANINTYNVASVSSRINPFATSGASKPSVQLLCGNTYVPQVPMKSVPEIYSEFSKSWHTLGNVNNKTVLTNSTYDNVAEPSAVAKFGITAFTAATDAFTCASTANLAVGNTIYFETTIAPVTAGVTYFIRSILSATTFTISTTLGGAAVDVAADNATPGTSAITSFTPAPYWRSSPSFAMGLNLDALYQSSATSMSGMNTQAGNVFLNATYSANLAASTRIDIFGHYDFILVIDPATKQMSVRI